MGYGDGSVNDNVPFLPGVGPVWVNRFKCSGNETSILTCPNSGWDRRWEGLTHLECSRHEHDASVECYNNVIGKFKFYLKYRFHYSLIICILCTCAVFCTLYNVIICSTEIVNVRLVDGSQSGRNGRLEVLLSEVNEWGTVCDDNFDDSDASVVCKMLNYSHGIMVKSQYGAGPRTMKIWLDEVDCRGNETHLMSCNFELGKHNCYHYEDVGIRCFGNYLCSISY